MDLKKIDVINIANNCDVRTFETVQNLIWKYSTNIQSSQTHWDRDNSVPDYESNTELLPQTTIINSVITFHCVKLCS